VDSDPCASVCLCGGSVVVPRACAQVAQLAAMLRSRGLQRGDRLCLFADAGPEWTMLFYACQYVGVGVCVREPRMPTAESVQIINTCEPKMVVANAADCEALQKALGPGGEVVETPWVATHGGSVMVVGLELAQLLEVRHFLQPRDVMTRIYPEVMRAGVTHVSTQRSVRRAQAGQSAIAEDDSLGACAGNPDDIALLVTTSGTTGTPKAAMHSQKALCESARATLLRMAARPCSGLASSSRSSPGTAQITSGGTVRSWYVSSSAASAASASCCRSTPGTSRT
jgi:long-subunit acyl-CoA synthetase (AMP-forming)